MCFLLCPYKAKHNTNNHKFNIEWNNILVSFCAFEGPIGLCYPFLENVKLITYTSIIIKAEVVNCDSCFFFLLVFEVYFARVCFNTDQVL